LGIKGRIEFLLFKKDKFIQKFNFIYIKYINMKVYSLLMIDDSPINLTEKEHSVIDMLQSLGLPRTEATAIVCLKDCKELRSLHIELVSGLRQPEVSVAMRPLKERGWVKDLRKRTKERADL
jgi:DNA-binding MarR family transcriptional regulator